MQLPMEKSTETIESNNCIKINTKVKNEDLQSFVINLFIILNLYIYFCILRY